MNIGIVGSRRRNSDFDKRLIKKTLQRYRLGRVQIISGGCPKGADRFAEEIAVEWNIPIKIHYPDKSKLDLNVNSRWAYTKIYHARNTLIANDAVILIALVAPDRRGGTEDTIKKFLKRESAEELILL